jgi:hypothetical protein
VYRSRIELCLRAVDLSRPLLWRRSAARRATYCALLTQSVHQCDATRLRRTARPNALPRRHDERPLASVHHPNDAPGSNGRARDRTCRRAWFRRTRPSRRHSERRLSCSRRSSAIPVLVDPLCLKPTFSIYQSKASARQLPSEAQHHVQINRGDAGN